MGQGSMNITPRGYSIPGSSNQSQYMQGAGAGNWGEYLSSWSSISITVTVVSSLELQVYYYSGSVKEIEKINS